MRGKLEEGSTDIHAARIIPAHAGQTVVLSRAVSGSSDHPRACGANSGLTYPIPSVAGSSPRMRGKPPQIKAEFSMIRIIPAHAGQTPLPDPARQVRTDHPRACGANSVRLSKRRHATGSSPRMRGKRTMEFWTPFAGRIIPAHAGQTSVFSLSFLLVPDHPRACGANKDLTKKTLMLRGSSPRMRGKRSGRITKTRSRRIIPAHAGQTKMWAEIEPAKPDHPRACGANEAVGVGLWRVRGSSPRMRGKHMGHRASQQQLRIIPAHAGQTITRNTRTSSRTDHPRACGANEEVTYGAEF